MEGAFIIRELESCYVCNEYMGTFKNELTVVTGYSEKPIYQLWESFSQTQIPQEVIESSGVCQNCFIKFNEYDEHMCAANKIQHDLTSLFEASNEEAVDEELLAIKEEHEKEDENLLKLEDGSFVQEIEMRDYFVMDNVQNTTEVDIKPTISAPKRKTTIQNATKKQKDDKDAGLLFCFVDGAKIYECDLCGKMDFTSRSRLKSHRATHSKERNFVCPTCNAAFKTSNCLKNHMRLHSNIFFFCDLCPSKFKGKHELRCHVDAIHLMRKDYKCHLCGKAFSRDKTLRQHIIYHNNQRNVTCEICGFKTINRPKLQRHMKSHTGERNYSCTICFKKFLYSYNVSSHIRHVHNNEKRPATDETKLTCHLCGKKFQKIWKVREHIAEIHQNESQDFEIGEGIQAILEY